MLSLSLKDAQKLNPEEVTWALAFTNIVSDIDNILNLPFPTFGITSHGGVFTNWGYLPGTYLLVALKDDDVGAKTYFVEGSVYEIEDLTQEVAQRIKREVKKPDMLMIFPTLGLEERVVRTLDKEFNSKVRIFGGTAADNDFSGDWWIFANGQKTSSGAVIVAFRSNSPILSTFHAGYILTKNSGIVTRATHPESGGTHIYEIDGKPATEVYASWLKERGFDIEEVIAKGGIIPFEVAGLNPIARKFGRDIVVSHVFEVLPKENALLILSYIEEGEMVYHATATDSFLVSRTAVTVKKSLEDYLEVMGGILVYCAGCIVPIKDRLNEIAKIYRRMVKNAPFVGAATYGEQGSLIVGGRIMNFHANQMIHTVLFTKRRR
ncbi:MAG: hypothetical protein GXO39_03575 [Thermotogae bacterium]|nr:hypothetical protein [Thermotogota bacterium]